MMLGGAARKHNGQIPLSLFMGVQKTVNKTTRL